MKNILGIDLINNDLSREVLECNCGIPEKGYKFIFKNSKAMGKFINFLDKLDPNNQPERSKREDLESCPEWGNCRTLAYDPRMRCSEHGG